MQIYEHTLWPAARHLELISEARRLHEAARAVREMRQAGKERRLGAAVRGTPQVQRSTVVGAPRRRRSAWRWAARRMGGSLVTIGRRLERAGGPSTHR